MIARPFDRYQEFTDIDALTDIADKPLRKSIRVNTLKMSVEEFRVRARKKGWALEQIPWCEEGFFIDREDRSSALGKDLLHLTGCMYMQEAASMLPAELLDPKQGEIILDMSAAPGSKTTQMAARMQSTGHIIANDVQEKRLWTLKTALHRSGVTNTIVSKKPGQWFGKHMTECFDCVLCDAPCTAQGTSRKDPHALMYSSQDNIDKMSHIQMQLLESAIHAAKIEGRIVYSTCTLTPEENEGVVRKMLEKFGEKIEVVDSMAKDVEDSGWSGRKAKEDSMSVQKSLQPIPCNLFPALRLWPQTFDTEGFFCAVLQKNAVTREKEDYAAVAFQESLLSRSKQEEIAKKIEELYGISFMYEGEILFRREDQLLLTSQDCAGIQLSLRDYSIGLPYAKLLKDGRVRLSHEMALLRGSEASKQTYMVTDDELAELLKGKDIPCLEDLYGDLLLIHDGICFGRALAKNGKCKNNLPRTMMYS
ncbi:hypothetical protein A3D11_04045 [Candidatus Peribacteria bacterium RIFCSPHIGHO2_02_FULL_49_16]|nr:MAG: hypothetical protein A2880_00135 [Candidatus Peribacteria bacterium RIFCSPHIGHO2_01_FULL_49_38]OGJ59170.1 MAG: hypothetical protein A3D11_04045 [Candidatus Peribacteria bacterium RIFCSPHIGHO2_02_FULL_49_16]